MLYNSRLIPCEKDSSFRISIEEERPFKRIVYGETGCGKSYTFIAPIIQNDSNVIYITEHGAVNEFESMGLTEDSMDIIGSNKEMALEVFKNIVIKNAEFKNLIFDLSKADSSERNIMLLDLLDLLEDNHFTDNEKNTIVICGFNRLIDCNECFVERIEQWKASVVLDYTCFEHCIKQGEIKHILESSLWTKIPVFQKIYEKYTYVEFNRPQS